MCSETRDGLIRPRPSHAEMRDNPHMFEATVEAAGTCTHDAPSRVQRKIVRPPVHTASLPWLGLHFASAWECQRSKRAESERNRDTACTTRLETRFETRPEIRLEPRLETRLETRLEPRLEPRLETRHARRG